MSLLKNIERHLDNLGRFILVWWVWPTVMLVLGVGAIFATWMVYPGEGEQMMFFGMKFGQECGFKQQFGFGCAGCGMTRSWVYTLRGDWLRAFDYNAGGALLFLFLAWGAPLGALRLILRKPDFLKTPFPVLITGMVVWLVLVLAIFIGRMNGINPLP